MCQTELGEFNVLDRTRGVLDALLKRQIIRTLGVTRILCGLEIGMVISRSLTAYTEVRSYTSEQGVTRTFLPKHLNISCLLFCQGFVLP
jgi:hypothetical protein